nr:trypsin-like peptidase domain-containing protein [uncultured Flavobacterium sp.]
MSNTKIEKPMTMEEVKKLPTIKAKTAEKALGTKALGHGPEMEMVDGFSFPKGTKSVGIAAREKGAKIKHEETDHYYPDHADFEYEPKLEPKSKRKPKFIDRDTFLSNGGSRTIFGADQRQVYYSTAYPWRCVGRVETALGNGSGVMVGPRHLLTCAHVIDWQANNNTGWVKFTPMYYNGGTPPYGSAFGIKTYYKYKVSGPTIDSTEGQYDYVVVVLDRNIGNSTGWLGSKSYTDSWDGSAVFTHAGYPGDITGGQRPTYQTGIALDGSFFQSDSHESIGHQADIWPGQSGGPFWGYWNGQPFVVATQSSQTPGENYASGGSDLVDLITKARTEFP